jgi:hypothetical protein
MDTTLAGPPPLATPAPGVALPDDWTAVVVAEVPALAGTVLVAPEHAATPPSTARPTSTFKSRVDCICSS